jgi:hypothetical protein
MSELLEKVRAESRNLPPKEKLLLGAELIDAAAFGEGAEEASHAIATAWDEEIQRRLEEIRNGKARLVPLPEAFARINFKFGWDS